MMNTINQILAMIQTYILIAKAHLEEMLSGTRQLSPAEIEERKHIEAEQARMQAAIDQPVTPVKRGRGRPRKTPAPSKA
jgi:hypothetical protein